MYAINDKIMFGGNDQSQNLILRYSIIRNSIHQNLVLRDLTHRNQTQN